jgi:hypothetical protein
MLAQLTTPGWIGWLICAGGAVLLAVLANLCILPRTRLFDSHDVAPGGLAAKPCRC